MNQSAIKRIIIGTSLCAIIVAAALYFHEKNHITKNTEAIPNNVIKIINNLDLPTEGSEKAKNKIIIFEDLKCPGCRQFHEKIYPQIKRELIDTKKARLTTVIVKLHPGTQQANTMAYCLNQQGTSFYAAFTNYIYKLDSEQDIPWATPIDLIAEKKISGMEKVNMNELKTCLKSKTVQKKGSLYLTILEKLFQSNAYMKSFQPATPTLLVNNIYIQNPTYSEIVKHLVKS